MRELPLGVQLPHSFGRYLLQERIGGGGMATVYRATFSGEGGFEKEVAVKVIRGELSEDPQFIQMFLDEARLSALLNHPNIVQTFDFGQVDGTYFLAMELVRGRTLSAVLETFRSKGLRLGASAGLFVAKELARALDHSHQLESPTGERLGIVHRDVSPQNVLISRDGDVKLVDFGIAKAAMRSQITQPGRVRGKCSYMAPEQARGLEVDARADVFALGALLWECLVGRRLFEGASDAAVLLQVIEGEIPPPSTVAAGIPEAIDELVLRLLCRDPLGRPTSGQAARELGELAFRLAQSPEDLDLSVLQQRLATASAAVSHPELDLTDWRTAELGERRETEVPWVVDPDAPTLVPQTASFPWADEPTTRKDLPQPQPQAQLQPQPQPQLQTQPQPQPTPAPRFQPRPEPRPTPDPEQEVTTRRATIPAEAQGPPWGRVLIPVAVAAGLGAGLAIAAMTSWTPWSSPGPSAEVAHAQDVAPPIPMWAMASPLVLPPLEPPPARVAPAMRASTSPLVLAPPFEPIPAPEPATAAATPEAPRPQPQPARARSVRPAPRPQGEGTLILSTRLPGTTVTIDGAVHALAPHTPLRRAAPAGTRRLVFEHPEEDRRCVVRVRIPAGEPLALLFDGDGVSRLQGLARQPLPCQGGG